MKHKRNGRSKKKENLDFSELDSSCCVCISTVACVITESKTYDYVT